MAFFLLKLPIFVSFIHIPFLHLPDITLITFKFVEDDTEQGT